MAHHEDTIDPLTALPSKVWFPSLDMLNIHFFATIVTYSMITWTYTEFLAGSTTKKVSDAAPTLVRSSFAPFRRKKTSAHRDRSPPSDDEDESPYSPVQTYPEEEG